MQKKKYGKLFYPYDEKFNMMFCFDVIFSMEKEGSKVATIILLIIVASSFF
jgi:hypothetical protein